MKEPRQGLGALRTLLPYMKAHQGRLVLALGLVISVAFIEMAQPYLVKVAIDRYIAVPVPHAAAVLWMAVAYLGMTLLSVGLTYGQEIILQYTGLKTVRAIRNDLFRHLQSLSLGFFDQNSAGRLITNVVNDTEALNNFFSQFLSITLRGLLSLLLIMFFMLRLDVSVALYCFILVPIIGAVSLYFRIRLRRIYNEIRNLLSAAIAFLAENLSGMSIIQIFHQEAKQQRKFDERNSALRDATIIENRTNLLLTSITELLGDAGVAALIWFGGHAVIRGTITFGVLYAFVGYIRRFFQPINSITQQLNVLQTTIIATERIARTLRVKPEIVELPEAVAPVIRGEIRFDNVSLAYQPGHEVLSNIRLTIQPGEKIGFVGASGAGKSSLLNLAARFYDATAGEVRIDGKDVREWPLEALRRTVGIVQQDVALFSGTIIDNIRFFRQEIPEERVREACRLVGAEPFILRLGKGYDTSLSERGSTLSAGERQLLSFARVLVFDPRILILDEATASLDTRTEAVLQKAIHRVSEGRTLLVIAHRLSTIQDMDAIVVLNQGRIVEKGTHNTLLQLQGHYWRLHRSGILLDEAAGPDGTGLLARIYNTGGSGMPQAVGIS
jgi:ATP-binding cassette subfamily B protein